VQSIVQRGVTVVPGVPPMWVAFSHFDELPADAFASVRLALSGASRLPPAVAQQMHERFGVQVLEGYGLTEASPVVTSSAGAGFRPGSVGRVLSGQEVRLVGAHGEDVPVGDAGELWVRGDNVFVGYFEDPEATSRVLVDGWLRTGDVGVVDDDGFLYLVNRAKELIIVSGFNVFPAEVEQVLTLHPDVADAVVLGVPHPHDGEAVKAYVVPVAAATVDEDALIEHCRDHLARYKCPSKVVFVDSLPRNAAGKVIRRELEGTILA
jgi:long-chain acyl-CoA synthetase